MSTTQAISPNNQSDPDEIEIRLSDIVQFLKSSRRTVIISGLIMLIIGVVYAFSKPDQYNVQVTVMPEIQSKAGGLGGLGSLAGLAGIDISSAAGGNMDAIRPDIYPDVLQSVPFALQLLQQSVYSQLLGKETSLQTFIEEQNKQSLLGSLLSSDSVQESPLPDPKNQSKTLQITKKQEIFINQIHNAVLATYDKKNGVITVAATMPDPVVAAIVARLSLEYLTNYISSYRTEKTRSQVRFLTHQVEEAKDRYQKAEYALSNYRDKNRSLYLNTAKIEEQRLQADFLLTQNLVNELSRQLEQAKIKVSEESPVFKVLEPARVPLKKSAPKRTFIILGFSIAGIILGFLVCGTRRFILNS
ncbi:Wzz/FepE/Etk N-terminal domain-containing protein [Spirosoma flavum]|uniref:Wzz/FepE/Etk N-terminal domain-containing protein n=1 Tax=Spirosoma flavum TaxID=2048557 RepID=A0ABW6AAZ0_9BACT